MTRTLLFGGTFDPIHLGHVRVPHAAMLHLTFDRVIYMPAYRSPLKYDEPQTPAHHRLAMLELALRKHPWATISTIEIDRGGTSYTIDSIELLLSELNEGDTLRLLIGADQWMSFDLWYRHETILKLTDPVIMPREGYPCQDDRLLPIEPLPAAATTIRELIREGKPIEHLVDTSIAAYIAQHNLYR